jgi:hypothetical protein
MILCDKCKSEIKCDHKFRLAKDWKIGNTLEHCNCSSPTGLNSTMTKTIDPTGNEFHMQWERKKNA